MPEERNWASITNGRTFEALVSTVVYFEDPGAALFGRPGVDGGQDVRSSDGSLVYQAKHHIDATAAKAIADAKNEATKIREYRTAGHARHDQWASVTQWRLVTNATFNPTDQRTWDEVVGPIFKSIGLAADYWERADLDALLIRHPEIDRAFFGGETRVFLTLPEVRAQDPVEPEFLVKAGRARFRGRDAELHAIFDFVESKRQFLVVHGAGGIGKTRLLLEAGESLAAEGEWQVLWANVASMEATGGWYDAVVRERRTLLLVDEPDTELLLRRLLEQLGSPGGVTRWKVAVAVRSPKDPVLRFLQDPKVKERVLNLPVGPLAAAESFAVCADLLGTGPLKDQTASWRERVAKELAERFARHPVWLGLAVHVLEEHGDLAAVPETAEGLAEKYLREVVEEQKENPPEQLVGLLRWVALLGTVAVDDEGTLRTLNQAVGLGGESSVKAALARLVRRRALTSRGARSRLVELKPDVLRDHVLRRWLTVDVGFDEPQLAPSDAARELVATVLDATCVGNINAQGRSVLVSLGRTELLLRLAGSEVDLLAPYFDGVLDRLDGLDASIRVLVADLLTSIAEARPDGVVELASAFRRSNVGEHVVETFLGPRTTSQADVVLSLAWPVFHAAMGARTPEQRVRVLDELCALVLAEEEAATQRPRGLPNDGRRAAQLVGRVIEGGPGFWGNFEAAAREIGARLLNEASTRPLSREEARAVAALLEPATAVERSQAWSEGHSIQIQNYVILPGHPAWTTRTVLISRVRELLADADTPVENRPILWEVFVRSHTSANRGSGRVQGATNVLRDEGLANLEWALGVLSGRETKLAELTAARELWNWHRRFDDDPARKGVADALEELYEANDLAGEFAPLVSYDNWEERGPRAAGKADELAAGADSTAIDEFIERGLRFLRDPDRFQELLHVGAFLGERAPDSEVVRVFIHSALGEQERSPRAEFAAVAASRWVWAVRQGEDADASTALVAELLDACRSDHVRILLTRRTYGFTPLPRSARQPTAGEHALLRSLAALFLGHQQGPAYLEAVGWTCAHDWDGLRALVERVLDEIPEVDLGLAVNALSDSIHWGIRDLAESGAPIPAGVGTWLLDQLVRVPDPDKFGGGMLHWRIEEVLKKAGRPDITWLVGALNRRDGLQDTPGGRVLPSQHRLSQYIRPICTDDANDPVIQSAVSAIIDRAADRERIAYGLLHYIADIDPQGVLVPAEVVGRLARLGEAETDPAWRLARVGGLYPLNSPAWRTIARPVVALAVRVAEKERRSLFHALTDPRGTSWSSGIGEVPQLFIDKATTAKEMLEAEQDAGLIPFWQWNLESAEHELEREVERAKEERGE